MNDKYTVCIYVLHYSVKAKQQLDARNVKLKWENSFGLFGKAVSEEKIF
jgi:hypothetical protein